MPLTHWGLILLGGIAIVCFLILCAYYTRHQKLERLFQERQTTWMQQIRELHTKMDFLSAEREISLILNEAVEFKDILQKVLQIASDLLSGSKSPAEFEIYLTHDNSSSFVPRVMRNHKGTFFDEQIPERATNDPLALQCQQHRQMLLISEGDKLSLAAPLIADREFLGVFKAVIPLEEEKEHKMERMHRLSQYLEEFIKFIALAIKTPDLYTRATEDSLTKLATKRHFMSQLAMYVEIAKRYGEPLSLIMLDIDSFKKINDTHGHLAGDQVIRDISAIVHRSIRREGDTAYSGYRYGGEELSIILQKALPQQALKLAERLRQTIAEHEFLLASGQVLKVTVSLGIAAWTKEMQTPEDLIRKADEALYQAKQNGRNCCRIANA